MPESRSHWHFLLLLAGICMLVLPFLQADPDGAISLSRDAFTDEGLNTVQVRNWINYGQFDVNECDNFVKMPLFGILMSIGFALLGTSWAAARITALFWTFLFLVLAWKRFGQHRRFLLFFIPIGLLNYYTFQYLRFSMAESISSAAILWSIAGFARAWQQSTQKHLSLPALLRIWLLPVLSIWLCAALKNQFLYLLPLWLLWFGWGLLLQYKNGIAATGRLISACAILFPAAGILYVLLFWLPFSQALQNIMTHQTSGRFVAINELYTEAKNNLIQTLGHPQLAGIGWIFALLCLLSLTAYIFRRDRFFVMLSGVLLLWFAAEWHKFGIRWVPARYLVPLFWAAAAWAALTLQRLWETPREHRFRTVFKSMAILSLSIILLWEARQLYFLHRHRNYAIQQANVHIAQRLGVKHNGVVLGPWAPALTWESRSRAVPVWKNFLNGADFDTRYQAAAWLSESDQGDNEGAFAAKGILLKGKGIQTDSFYIRNTWIYFRKAD